MNEPLAEESTERDAEEERRRAAMEGAIIRTAEPTHMSTAITIPLSVFGTALES